MAKYKYNGILLPDLPDWDKDAHPQSFIYAVGSSDGTTITGEVYNRVIGSAIQFTYDGTGIYCIFSSVADVYSYNQNTGAWEDANGVTEDFYVKRGEETEALFIRVAWSNFDILNQDGSVYVAASDPEPVFDIKNFLLGYLIGLAEKPKLLETGGDS